MDQKHRQFIHDNMEALIDGTSNINTVLSKLLHKGVFQDYMVEMIEIEGNERGRLKIMYEMVTRRGPDAYTKLYEAFYETGHTELAQLLKNNGSCGDDGTDKLLKAFKRLDIDKTECYCMGSRPKGHMLLINMRHFVGVHQARLGSQNDEIQLDKLWTQMGYQVRTLVNLTRKEFEEEVKKFSQLECHKDCDSAVLFVMTHGNKSSENLKHVDLVTHDDLVVSSNWILEQFTVTNSPHLKGKPKLIFFQACRGDIPELHYVQRDSREISYPEKGDILVVYPCTPGTPALRNVIDGAFFVQVLCKVFKEQACDTDLVQMLFEVNKRLKKLPDEKEGFQVIAMDFWNFNKKLYFNPGLYDN